MASFWDSRYGSNKPAYGTTPNDFLASSTSHIPAGSNILSLGEGEGRNAFHLAKTVQNSSVHAIDLSSVGLAKLDQIAKEQRLNITTQVADLDTLVWRPQDYDVVVDIWCHLPKDIFAKTVEGVISTLKVGGLFIMEHYTPANVGRGTGGPPNAAMCTSCDELLTIVSGRLQTVVAQEVERVIDEGEFHQGLSATLQYIGRKL